MLKRMVVAGAVAALASGSAPAYAAPPVGSCPSSDFRLLNQQQVIAEALPYFPGATAEQIAAEFQVADRNNDGLICSQNINQHNPIPLNYIDDVAHPQD
jgi:hypothetical protein